MGEVLIETVTPKVQVLCQLTVLFNYLHAIQIYNIYTQTSN